MKTAQDTIKLNMKQLTIKSHLEGIYNDNSSAKHQQMKQGQKVF